MPIKCTDLQKYYQEKPQLKFYEKSVYGNLLIYPVAELQNTFTTLTGAKTAQMHHLRALKDLGFQVIINKADYEATIL